MRRSAPDGFIGGARWVRAPWPLTLAHQYRKVPYRSSGAALQRVYIN